MLVTRLEELSKTRTRVYIDYEFAFVLYKGELRRYHVIEGKELLEEDYKELTETILPKRAKARCMHLLEKRTYTEQQLYNKLKQDYIPTYIQGAIDYVKSYGYVDDEQYAYDYITYHMEGKSKRQLSLDLYKRGIPKEMIQNKLEELLESNEEREIELIQKLLAKKQYDSTQATKEEKERWIGRLLRRGFSYDKIKQCVL